MKLQRTNYHPAHAVVTTTEKPATYVAKWQDENSLYVAAFGGKRSKPDLYFKYENSHTGATKRATRINNWMANQKTSDNERKARRAQRSRAHNLEIGQVFYSSWGYDQTNVDFYEIVDVPSACYVVVREVAKVRREGAGNDSVSAAQGEFIGEPMRKKVDMSYRPSIKVGHQSAWIWDGRPKHETSWGYGH